MKVFCPVTIILEFMKNNDPYACGKKDIVKFLCRPLQGNKTGR